MPRKEGDNAPHAIVTSVTIPPERSSLVAGAGTPGQAPARRFTASSCSMVPMSLQ